MNVKGRAVRESLAKERHELVKRPPGDQQLTFEVKGTPLRDDHVGLDDEALVMARQGPEQLGEGRGVGPQGGEENDRFQARPGYTAPGAS